MDHSMVAGPSQIVVDRGHRQDHGAEHAGSIG